MNAPLPMRFYRNPEAALMAAEAKTCAGCSYELKTLDPQHPRDCARRRVHGARCADYLARDD